MRVVSVAEADRLLASCVQPVPTVTVPLGAAVGRVLREAVVAERDHPPFDRVAMDGVAVAAAGVEAGRRFRVAGVQRAGEPPHALPSPDACVEVMTGGVLPLGADTVVRKEDLIAEGATVRLADGVAVRPGQNVHRRGSDRAAGAVVLEVGTRLGAPHVAALAAEGRSAVPVAARPRVAVVTTGDEVVAVDAPVAPHQIRGSNGPAVLAALAAHGFFGVPLAHAPDDPAALDDALARALAAADVLVLTGGVSAGRFDLVPARLTAAGVREGFHGVRQKPGKPLWFGVSGRGPAVFGLPGNPVSALVGLYRYVLPFLAAAEGAPYRPRTVRLADGPAGNSDLTRFVPVRLDGEAAVPLPWNGSGDFLALLPSDGFAEVAPGVAGPAAVPFYPWGPC